MSEIKSMLAEDYLKALELRARTVLVEDGDSKAPIKAADVLFLLDELKRVKTTAKIFQQSGEYQDGYRDGWMDSASSLGETCKPVAWAVLSKQDKVVKVYADPPKSTKQGEEVRPLFVQPNT